MDSTGDRKSAGAPVVRITLFGGLRVEIGGSEEIVTRFRSQKIAALLAYLALYPQRSHTREELADLFWPDALSEAGRTNLRTALSSLRRQIEAPGMPAGGILNAGGNFHVSLTPSTFTTDVADFDAALQAAARPTLPPAEKIARLTEAIALYRGPLLPGFYETWVLTERERLQEAYLSALGTLSRLQESAGDIAAALASARQIVAADRFNEEAHAEIIRLLMADGKVTAARNQFEELKRLLASELDTEPSPETEALLSQPIPKKEKSRVSASIDTTVSANTPQSETPASTTASPSPAPAATPVRLPLTLTRFFGREEETSQLIHSLCGTQTDGHSVRLVTVSGPGGSGKTRFAIETARQLTSFFAGGIWFAELGDVRSAEAIPDAIAKAMEIPSSAAVSALEQVVEALTRYGERAPTLLVLDTFEQLVDAGGGRVVHELLYRIPTLSCLVTSRQRLLLDGEQDMPLLPLPTPSHPGSPERLLEFPSVRLFVNRAQLARPDFQLRLQNAVAVAELCSRLEGIPLALELAAAWSQTLTPLQMLERMQTRFDLLIARRRDVPGRHATLRATIEWSFQLLPAEIRRFLIQLSVFRDGWTLAAAEAVTGESQAFMYLAELRERSLIVSAQGPAWPSASASTTDDDNPTDIPEEPETIRFRMLDSVREFAWEQVGDDGERNALSERHFRYYLRLMETAEPELRGGNQAIVLRQLEAENPNFRTALAWALENVPDSALHLASALGWFWIRRCRFHEGRVWMERALEATAANEARNVHHIQALQHMGVISYWQADYDATRRHFSDSLQLAEALDLKGHQSFAWFGLSIGAMNEAKFTDAANYAWRSLELAEYDPDDAFLMARPLIPLSHIAVLQGDTESAFKHIDRFISLMRSAGDKWEMTIGLVSRGVFLRHANANEEAERNFRESLLLSHEMDDAQGIVFGLWGIAGIRAAQGRHETAAHLFGAAERLSETIRNGVVHIWAVLLERDIPLVRAALGSDEVTRLWNEGRSLAIEQAVKLAVDQGILAPGR